jgi:glycosyltransferase involved in cell wall biosynthesis
MDQLVTIGLPFYNAENTIELAIKSIILQSYRNWELIIINDGSTDNSHSVIFDLINSDNRIKYYNFKSNMGLVFRLNQITDLSKANYIARMDSDDIMAPNRIEKQISILLNDSTLDVVSTGIIAIDDFNNPIGLRDISPLDISLDTILKKKFITHPTIIAKKEWFINNRYLEFPRAEDLELWLRTFKTSKFYRIQEPLYFYREGSVSINNYLKTNETLIKIISSHKSLDLGLLLKLRLLYFTRLKALIYLIFGYFNLQNYLVKFRSTPISINELLSAKKTISYISNFKIYK